MSMSDKVRDAKETIKTEQQEVIKGIFVNTTMGFRKVLNNVTIRLYKENFSRTNLPQHKYRKRTHVG